MPTGERSWRQLSASFIDAKIREYPQLAGAELRAAVNADYPFGERSNLPYRVWCEEMAKRFGKQRPTPANAKIEIKKREYEALMAAQGRKHHE